MNRARLIFLMTVGLAIVGFDRELQVATASDGMTNVEWVLRSMETIGGDVIKVTENEKYTILFRSNLAIIGQCDCNDYSADYIITEDSSLTIKNLINTEAACSPTTKCWDFLEGLQSASTYEIQDNVLRIYYNDKRILNFFTN